MEKSAREVKDHLVVGERVQEDDDDDGEDVGQAEDDVEQAPQAFLLLLTSAKSDFLLKICRRKVKQSLHPWHVLVMFRSRVALC